MEIFNRIYTLFDSLYGAGEGELAQYLAGEASSVNQTNQFFGFFVMAVCIAMVVACLYYLVLGKALCRPSWGNLVTWFISMGVAASLGFCSVFGTLLKQLNEGEMVTQDPVTNEMVDLPISSYECFLFSCVQAGIVAVLFFLFSLVVKQFSRDYSKIPF